MSRIGTECTIKKKVVYIVGSTMGDRTRVTSFAWCRREFGELGRASSLMALSRMYVRKEEEERGEKKNKEGWKLRKLLEEEKQEQKKTFRVSFRRSSLVRNLGWCVSSPLCGEKSIYSDKAKLFVFLISNLIYENMGKCHWVKNQLVTHALLGTYSNWLPNQYH